jgi:hypothetical protein
MEDEVRHILRAAVQQRVGPAQKLGSRSITVFEARFGLALLPKGKRRSSLEQAFDRVLTDDLQVAY